MYFSQGFPAEWIETETIDGKTNWNHFNVKPNDKNIDKICKIWHDYGMKMVQENDMVKLMMKSFYWVMQEMTSKK